MLYYNHFEDYYCRMNNIAELKALRKVNVDTQKRRAVTYTQSHNLM